MPLEIPDDVVGIRRKLDPAAPLIPDVYGRRAEILPFRARDVVDLPPGGAVDALVGKALHGSLSLLEYAYSSVALASNFSLDPRAVVAGIDDRGGALTVRVSPSSPRIPRGALMRFIRYMNALADGMGLKWSAGPEYVDEVARFALLVCGSLDRAALERLLRSIRFKLEADARNGYGLAKFLCGALRNRRAPAIRISLPGWAFSTSCVDSGVKGAVMFSDEFPKAMNYLVGSGDVVELVSGTVARRRALLLRDLPKPEGGAEGFRSLGGLALDCSDPFAHAMEDGPSVVRIRPGAYNVNPSIGVHALFPEVDDEYVDLNARACPVCGTLTYSVRCPSCGGITEPVRICPSCRNATKSDICEKCGTPTTRLRRFRVNFSREISRFRRAEGITGEADFPGGAYEDLMKGVLRARYGLKVCCDGTTRSAAVLLGAAGLGGCSLLLPFKSARVLFEISRFVDEVAAKAFSHKPPYNLSNYRDLRGLDVIVLPRGGSIGYVARVSGFVDAPIGFSGPMLPRGQVSLILPFDLAWNASPELRDARIDRCGWGTPNDVVECGSDAGGDVPGGMVFMESNIAPGADERVELERALERNVAVLSSLGSRELGGVCTELRASLEDLVRLYASSEVICDNCGRRLRRSTMSGTCPYCGGKLRQAVGKVDLDALRSLAEAVNKICSPAASITVDRLVNREKQSRLTDFVRCAPAAAPSSVVDPREDRQAPGQRQRRREHPGHRQHERQQRAPEADEVGQRAQGGR